MWDGDAGVPRANAEAEVYGGYLLPKGMVLFTSHHSSVDLITSQDPWFSSTYGTFQGFEVSEYANSRRWFC